MELREYADIVQSMELLKEDIRHYRELNLDTVYRCAQLITDYVKIQGNAIETLLTAKEFDNYESTHPVDVAIIATYIGKWLQFQPQPLLELACAGLLHDIGKAKIRDSLLRKKIEITEEDMEVLRTHPQKGYECIENVDKLSIPIKEAIRYHHERRDGTGYPQGLIGDEIPLFAKIVAVADIFDAMTSKRVFSDKQSIHKAVNEIARGSFENLDPTISQLFHKKICECYIGMKIMLNNGEVGNVVYVYPLHPYYPVIHTEQGQYDLAKQKNLEIVDFFTDV